MPSITFDPTNPDDVDFVMNLLGGDLATAEPEPEPAPAPAPTRAPPGRAAPNAARTPPAAGRPAPGRAPASAPARSAPAPGVTKDEVAAAVQAYAKAHGPAAAKAAFADYGAAIGVAVTNISGIPADDYENAITYFPA